MDTQIIFLSSHLLCVLATLEKLPKEKEERKNTKKLKNLDSPGLEQGSLALTFTNRVNTDKSYHPSELQLPHL